MSGNRVVGVLAQAVGEGCKRGRVCSQPCMPPVTWTVSIHGRMGMARFAPIPWQRGELAVLRFTISQAEKDSVHATLLNISKVDGLD